MAEILEDDINFEEALEQSFKKYIQESELRAILPQLITAKQS